MIQFCFRKYKNFSQDEILNKWKEAIPNGHALSKHHLVCELHFKEQEVDKEFVQILKDGSKFTMKKDRPLLKKGAVPSVFPSISSEINSTSKKIECFVKKNYQTCQSALGKYFK